MAYFILTYLAGALTIFAPCILPVVPFVFARVDRPFATSSLPLLAGMAVSFAAVASLGAVAGGWAVQANAYGRWVAMAMLALLGATLLAPALAERLSRPLVAIGSRLSASAWRRGAAPGVSRVPTSFVLGAATGLLWAPCAGPVLGLVLTAAALRGPTVGTSLLLLSYAAGAASSLALVLGMGRRMVAALQRTQVVTEWLRRGLGVAVLAGVAAVAAGLDTAALGGSSRGGNALEKSLLDRLGPPVAATPPPEAANPTPDSGFRKVQLSARPSPTLPSEGPMPPLTGAVQWLNSPPLTAAQLRGKVVLIDFWTFGCSNCRNDLPHVTAWYRKYKDQGLVVIGVHSPEFAFEKSIPNVERALGELDVPFPVAVDNDFVLWRAFRNNYWPAHYVVDAHGRVRFHHFGEGAYDQSEEVIRQLLDEARKEAKSS